MEMIVKSDDYYTRVSCIAIFSITCIWFIKIWFFSNASWLHPELLGTSVYIWNNPDETTLQTLRKVFDWKAFDPNVNRVRPLNDVVETIDAMSRPFLSKVFGPHPSAMPSALITAVVAPLFLLSWLRKSTSNTLIAIMLCMLFVSSTGFLSVLIGYIRPAKKLNIIFMCMSLYFAARFSENKRVCSFSALYASLLASFFSDESGLANFVIIGVLYWQNIFRNPLGRFSSYYLSLPVVFIFLTKFALPVMYNAWSVHGAWDALSDTKKLVVFKYLLESSFYKASLEGLARSLMATVAISRHIVATEITTLVIFLGLPIVHIIHKRLFNLRSLLADRFILITLIVIATSTYITLLDWYPFPYETSYLGSFNYYYHSSIVIPIIMWLAIGIDNYIKLDNINRFASVCITVLSSILIIANFILFQDINRLAQIIHLYPYSNDELWSTLKSAVQQKPNRNDTLGVTVVADKNKEANKYRAGLNRLFGDRWNQNGFYSVMGLIAPNPIMSDAHINHFFKSTLPRVNVKIKYVIIRGEGWRE